MLIIRSSLLACNGLAVCSCTVYTSLLVDTTAVMSSSSWSVKKDISLGATILSVSSSSLNLVIAIKSSISSSNSMFTFSFPCKKVFILKNFIHNRMTLKISFNLMLHCNTGTLYSLVRSSMILQV